MDNYAAHKTPAVQRWLTRHPRWHVHFTPTGASWLNQIERFCLRTLDTAERQREINKTSE